MNSWAFETGDENMIISAKVDNAIEFMVVQEISYTAVYTHNLEKNNEKLGKRIWIIFRATPHAPIATTETVSRHRTTHK